MKHKLVYVQAVMRHAKAHGQKAAGAHYGLTIHQVKEFAKRLKKTRMKSVIALTPDELNRRRKMAVNYARKKGRYHQAEDFGSYFVVEALTRGNLTIKYSYVAFCRQTNGDFNTQAGALRHSANANHIDVNDPAVIEVGEEDRYINLHLEYAKLITTLGINSEMRPYFILGYMWGMDNKELAFIFNREVSDIDERIKAIVERVGERFL